MVFNFFCVAFDFIFKVKFETVNAKSTPLNNVKPSFLVNLLETHFFVC